MVNIINSTPSQILSPTVDVIIPFHVVDEYLIKSIGSVRASRGVLIRVIAVNDTEKEVVPQQIGLSDYDILVKSEKRGYQGALSTGVSICNSEYIAFQDSDDFADLDRLSKQIIFLKENDVDIVTGKLIRTDMSGKPLKSKYVFGSIPDHLSQKQKLMLGPHGADSSILGKRSIIQENWQHHSCFTTTFADYGWLLSLQDSIKIRYCSAALYFYRSHSGQMSRKISDSQGWAQVFPLWFKNLSNEMKVTQLENEETLKSLREYPVVGLCLAFPSFLPRLTKAERTMLEWLITQLLRENYANKSLLKETLYRRGFIGTRGKIIRFWPAGLRMFTTALVSYFNGVRPRIGK